MSKPIVLFLCQHNAGRSQLGAALLEHIAGNEFDVRSAGISPDETVNQAVAASLAELEIDVSGNTPRAVTLGDLDEADVVIAMKPGLALPSVPLGDYIQWAFPDPADWGLDGVRSLRTAIEQKLREFVASR